MKVLNLALLLLLASCSSGKITKVEEEFCQNLNVLLTKSNVHSFNMANVNTTRTIQGGPYKRQIAKNCKDGLCEIVDEERPFILKYEPGHPDADPKGYVSYPNISQSEELREIKRYQNIYELLVKHGPVDMEFFMKDKRSEHCFKKFPALNAALNIKSYLN